MIFPAQQWHWKVAHEQCGYGYVSNCVRIYPQRGRCVQAYVTVPGEFFQLLDTLLSDADKAQAAAHGIEFFLEEFPAGTWIFCFQIADSTTEFDLWAYSDTKLPRWASLALGRG